MNSNFFEKFQANRTKRQSRPSARLKSTSLKTNRLGANRLKTNRLEAEFHQIAYGSGQQSRLKQRAAHRKTVGAVGRAPAREEDYASPTKSIWQQWGLSFVNFLTGKQTLSVREKILKHGERQWIVYDSRSDTRHVFDSEAAVRSWLEQRYYR